LGQTVAEVGRWTNERGKMDPEYEVYWRLERKHEKWVWSLGLWQ